MGLLDFFGFQNPSNTNKRALAFSETIAAQAYLIQSVLCGHPLVASTEWVITAADGVQSNKILIAAPTAPLTRTHVMLISAFLSASVTVPVDVRIGFGAGSLSAESNGGIARVILNAELTAGGGINRGSGTAQIGQSSAGHSLVMNCDAPTGGKLIVLASYFQSDIP